jgi:hypothetical protein
MNHLGIENNSRVLVAPHNNGTFLTTESKTVSLKMLFCIMTSYQEKKGVAGTLSFYIKPSKFYIISFCIL